MAELKAVIPWEPNSPNPRWQCNFDAKEGCVILGVHAEAIAEVRPVVRRLARSHDLTFYDPQQDELA